MAASPRITARLPPTKTVTVYRNGDAFYPGKKVVMNPRHLSTFDNFMNTLTRHMEAPFGAVRRLYTPTKGHSVQELDQLKHGGSYVAAGKEPFKIKPVPHTRVVASARWRKIRDGTCTINVFSNGELRIPPARVRIPKHTLKSWDRVLSMVTHKVELRTGAVYKLCRLDGRPVSGSSELENNQHYVAVGPEKFKPLPYERGEGKQRGPEGSGASSLLPACLLTVKQPGSGSHRSHSQHGWRPVGPIVWDLRYPPAIRSPCPLVDSCSLLLERATDSDSVFNAKNKRSEVEGAAEVQEDPHLKVDLPIDQVRYNPTQPPPNERFSIQFALFTDMGVSSHVFPSEQVEAKTVEEEHEASTSTANRKSSDATRPKKTKAAGYKKHVSTLYNKFYVVLSHIQFIFTSLLCPIFSFALELGHMKMA
uniref:Si:dkey-25g12.4 n=1 Tax=Xiphophorus maculatus TaxID=8083 RepID=M4A0N5_XIPMA